MLAQKKKNAADSVWVLKKCSETQPSKRYSDDKDFVDLLELLLIHAVKAYLNGRAPVAPPGSAPCQQGGWCVCRSKRDTKGVEGQGPALLKRVPPLATFLQ